jgi:hypothetical protein
MSVPKKCSFACVGKHYDVDGQIGICNLPTQESVMYTVKFHL